MLLAACGGGGGDSSPPQGAAIPPVAPAPAPGASYGVGGSLGGLAAGSELKVALNGGLPLVLGQSGAFSFPNSLASGTTYAVTIAAQPAGQTCTIAGGSGSGTLAANVGNVAITCETTPPVVTLATIGGSIAGLEAGATLSLVNNGGTPVAYNTSGSFSFSNLQGAPYSLSVARQPAGQWCKVTGSAGIATEATTPVTVNCQSAQLVLLAGNGGGPGSANGAGTNARFTRPMGVVLDSAGNLFVADRDNSVIRKITPAGVVSTFVGSTGQFASVDGAGNAARFGSPLGLAIDPDDNLYVTDAWFNKLRKITPAGMVSTLADKPTMTGAPDVPATDTSWHLLAGIVRDAAGNLYVANSGNNVIRKRAPDGTVTTLTGRHNVCGHADGAAGAATFCGPTGIALDASGNLIVIDVDNQLVRKVSPQGAVTTLAGVPGQAGGRDGPGATATFGFPHFFYDARLPLPGIVVEPSGSVLLADYYNGRLRRIGPNGDVTAAAGLGEGYIDGDAANARFRNPTGIVLGAGGQVFIAEDTHVIRKLASGQVSTFAGKPLIGDQIDGVGRAAYFSNILGLAVDASGNIFVADENNHAIRKVTQAGLVTTFAGRANRTIKIEAGPAPDQVVNPNGIAIDRAGNLYVIDRSCVRKIAPDGSVTILAGSFVDSGYVDAAGATARFSMLSAIAVDDKGNVFVKDSYTFRKISPDGSVSTVARSGCGYRDGPQGEFCNVNGMVLDRAGNLYFSDSSNRNIRKLSPDGIMSTLAGNMVANSSRSGSADGQGAAAEFSSPGSLAIDSAGNLYVADGGNYTVRMITPAGAVSTLVGTVGRYEVHEGPLPAMIAGAVLAIGPDDRLYIGSANAVLTINLK
ncbi:hypothetical protein [Massilia niabensis]